MSKKKIKIPKSVLKLRISEKKFAKENGMEVRKGMSKKEKAHAKKRIHKAYAENAIAGMNKAVKILVEHPDAKKINKVQKGVDNIISNPKVMKKIAKIYDKHPEEYSNLMYLPYMIINTISYYSSDSLSDEEKKVAEELDKEGLTEFCAKILKKPIKRYEKMGLSEEIAFQLAAIVPTAKLFKNKGWYKKLINQMYAIASNTDIDAPTIFKVITKVDKNKVISKHDFMDGFFSEFIMQRSTNKALSYTDTQKDLHESLIEGALVYMNNLKARQLKSMLKEYIKRRKTAEKYNNDTKRVIKFIDYANSNSQYTTLKEVVQDLIADNSSNELYLS